MSVHSQGAISCATTAGAGTRQTSMHFSEEFANKCSITDMTAGIALPTHWHEALIATIRPASSRPLLLVVQLLQLYALSCHQHDGGA